jgi:hypothetical protein
MHFKVAPFTDVSALENCLCAVKAPLGSIARGNAVSPMEAHAAPYSIHVKIQPIGAYVSDTCISAGISCPDEESREVHNRSYHCFCHARKTNP